MIIKLKRFEHVHQHEKCTSQSEFEHTSQSELQTQMKITMKYYLTHNKRTNVKVQKT